MKSASVDFLKMGLKTVGKVEFQKQKGLLHIWAREVEGCEAIGEYLMNEMEEDVNQQDEDGRLNMIGSLPN